MLNSEKKSSVQEEAAKVKGNERNASGWILKMLRGTEGTRRSTLKPRGESQKDHGENAPDDECAYNPTPKP